MDIIPDIITLTLIFFTCIYPKIKEKPLKEKIPVFLFCIYMTALFNITLMPFFDGMKLAFADEGYNCNLNLIPYIDVVRHRGDYLRQIYLNILLFVPFGFLYPIIRKESLLKTVIYGFLLSLSIETLQYFFSVRIADITDLINNTAGVLAGAVVYYSLIQIFDYVKIHSEETSAVNKGSEPWTWNSSYII